VRRCFLEEVLFGRFFEESEEKAAGVIDHDMRRAELGQHLVHCPFQQHRIGQIRGEVEKGSVLSVGQRAGQPDHGGALSGQAPGGRLADPP
jgi:hypothetical protein